MAGLLFVPPNSSDDYCVDVDTEIILDPTTGLAHILERCVTHHHCVDIAGLWSDFAFTTSSPRAEDERLFYTADVRQSSRQLPETTDRRHEDRLELFGPSSGRSTKPCDEPIRRTTRMTSEFNQSALGAGWQPFREHVQTRRAALAAR